MLLRLLSKHMHYKTRTVRINSREYDAIVADTMTKRMIGLMYRKSIKRDECMLFVFPVPSRYGIWMHNMSFSIDVVWLGRTGRVVDLIEEIEPCRALFGCRVYKPRRESLYILEFNSGTIKRDKIKMGNTAQLASGSITHSSHIGR